jgi:hypothetical protein
MADGEQRVAGHHRRNAALCRFAASRCNPAKCRLATPSRKTANARATKKLEVRLVALAAALRTAMQIVFDFETTATDPHVAEPVGLGVYLPHEGPLFYINVGHDLDDAQIPRHDPRDLAEVLRPFFAVPQRHPIAHNATFELRPSCLTDTSCGRKFR